MIAMTMGVMICYALVLKVDVAMVAVAVVWICVVVEISLDRMF